MTLHCVLAALATATKSRNGREKADARGLLLQLKSFDFIYDLVPASRLAAHHTDLVTATPVTIS